MNVFCCVQSVFTHMYGCYVIVLVCVLRNFYYIISCLLFDSVDNHGFGWTNTHPVKKFHYKPNKFTHCILYKYTYIEQTWHKRCNWCTNPDTGTIPVNHKTMYYEEFSINTSLTGFLLLKIEIRITPSCLMCSPTQIFSNFDLKRYSISILCVNRGYFVPFNQEAPESRVWSW